MRLKAIRLSAGEELIEGPLKGYHHETYAFPLPDADGRAGAVRWKCREPRDGILWFDRRSFPSEGALIRELAGRVSSVPEIVHFGEIGLQRFVEGWTLASYGPPGAPVQERHAAQIDRLFRELAAITPGSLPLSPATAHASHAADGDCAGFAAELIRFTEERVYRAHLPVYGELFAALGIDAGPLRLVAETARSLTRRPFCLLHGDLHRENFIVDPAGRLWTIDWELAAFGDPLYDLATHLHLMRYPADQEPRAALRWRDAVEDVLPGGAAGWQEDLPALLAYKRVQSLYTDVIRAALAVARDGDALAGAARKVREAVVRADAVLGLPSPPTERRVGQALADSRRAARRGRAWRKR